MKSQFGSANDQTKVTNGAVEFNGLILPTAPAPVNSSAPGIPGQVLVADDRTYVYFYIDSDYGWKRMPLENF